MQGLAKPLCRSVGSQKDAYTCMALDAKLGSTATHAQTGSTRSYSKHKVVKFGVCTSICTIHHRMHTATGWVLRQGQAP